MNLFKPKITYDKALTEKARFLRNNSTLTEVLLWNELKRGRRRGYDFHRQKPILHWIVDFFCYDLMLVIEIDGNYHDREDVRRNDQDRQERMEALGITFLRFRDETIKHDIQAAIGDIEEYIDAFEKTRS
ncbi:endonuclease domain-containing protein [Roseivirga echinicomitans]